MRRIETKEVREKRRKRNIAIMSIFMLVILVSGTVGFAYSFYGAGTDSASAGGNKKVKEGEVGYDDSVGRYFLRFSGRDIYFFNSPDAVKEVPIDAQVVLNDYAGRPLYIDAEKDIIADEISSTLGLVSSTARRACYGECDKDLPEKDCSSNLIIVKESEEEKVYQEERCVFIEGKMRTVDAFLYKVFGVNSV